MIYVHGHAACAQRGCPMYGVNQAECCAGETAESCGALVIDRAPATFVDEARDDRPGR